MRFSVGHTIKTPVTYTNISTKDACILKVLGFYIISSSKSIERATDII